MNSRAHGMEVEVINVSISVNGMSSGLMVPACRQVEVMEATYLLKIEKVEEGVEGVCQLS